MNDELIRTLGEKVVSLTTERDAAMELVERLAECVVRVMVIRTKPDPETNFYVDCINCDECHTGADGDGPLTHKPGCVVGEAEAALAAAKEKA